MSLITDNAKNIIRAREKIGVSFVETIRPLIDESPFNDPDFGIVEIDLANVSFISQNNRALVVGLVSLVGGLLSIVTVLVGHAIQQRDVKTAAA